MALLSIITVKFVAMGLSKELFGNYNSAYGYLQLFGILADFGLYAVAVREVSRVKNRAEVLGALIILRCVILALALALALVFVWILPVWKGTPLPLGVTIAALVPFFTLLAGILRTIFQVSFKMHYVFVAEVTQRIVTASLIGLLVLLGVRGSTDLDDYHHFLFIGGVGAFVLFFLSFLYGDRLMKIRPQWNGALIKDLVKKAAPFGLAYLCIALYRQSDVTLIALLRTDYDLQNAYYGPVIRMMDMAFLIPMFLLNSALPVLSERDSRGEPTKGILGKTFLAVTLLSGIAGLFAYFWARPLVELLTTSAFLSTATRPGSDTALRLLAIPMFLNGIALFGFYVLLTRHRWKELTAVLGAGAILSVTLNMLLIPDFGFVGASATSIAVHIFLSLFLLPLSFRAMRFSLSRQQLIRWFFFLLAAALFLWGTASLLVSSSWTLGMLFLASSFLLVLAWITGLPHALGMGK